jgi:hypothetical protein
MKVFKGKNVTAAERDHVVRWTKKCLRELAKKEYEIEYGGNPVTYQMMLDHIEVHVKARSQRSYGGSRGITIDVMRQRWGDRFMREYAAIENDPTIGTYFGDPKMVTACIVAHEVAHHVQLLYGRETRWLKNKWRKAHGEGWRAIYRILRRELINTALETRAAA